MSDFVTLWIGDTLGPVERACLRSMLRHGDRVSLYCYKQPEGVPDGILVKDASSIISLDVLQGRCGGRPDLYSDWFRYLLLQRGLGTWLDSDVYLVAEIDGETPYLFGEESPKCINNAVLRLPPDSVILSRLIDLFERHVTPGWLPWRYYLPMRLRQAISGTVDLTRTPWGTTSPLALTALAGKHGVAHLAQPPERFYPVSWRDAGWILDPAVRLEDVTTRDTVAVHLWNECIKAFKNDPAPAGSFLARLHEEGR